jgi:SAM-dependent methyltransferase
VEEIRAKAERLAADLQPWPNYFESKAREFMVISHFLEAGRVGSALEIGCGNGFTASLIAGMANTVTALDLPAKDAASHSLGIAAAEEYIARLGIGNVSVIGGSAEKIPFPDGAFDLVFSEYALQYVRDKRAALREMRRALNKGGRVVTVVPNFTERVFAPIMKYEYVLRRLFARLSSDNRRAAGRARSPIGAAGGGDKKGILASADDWLLLRPDGAYASFIEEMLCHTPFRWKKLFEENGLRVIKTFATEMLPLGALAVLGSSAVNFIARKGFYINTALGGLPALRELGFSFCLVAKADQK